MRSAEPSPPENRDIKYKLIICQNILELLCTEPPPFTTFVWNPKNFTALITDDMQNLADDFTHVDFLNIFYIFGNVSHLI